MLSVAAPLGLEGGCDAHPWVSSSIPPVANIQKHHVSVQASKQVTALSQVTCSWSSPTSRTQQIMIGTEWNGTTYSDHRLGLQLDVSQLAIGTRLAGHGKNDHPLVGLDTARDVLKVDRQHVYRYETGVLTAAAVEAVRHGVVHVRVGDDLTSLGVHLRDVPVRLLEIKVVCVVVVGVGGPAATETCDRDVTGVAQKTVAVSGIDVRGRGAEEVGTARSRKGSGVDIARSTRGFY